jgi:hypothetical protein
MAKKQQTMTRWEQIVAFINGIVFLTGVITIIYLSYTTFQKNWDDIVPMYEEVSTYISDLYNDIKGRV